MQQKLNPSEMMLESSRGLSVTSVEHYAEDSWRLNFEAGRSEPPVPLEDSQ